MLVAGKYSLQLAKVEVSEIFNL